MSENGYGHKAKRSAQLLPQNISRRKLYLCHCPFVGLSTQEILRLDINIVTS
jgi:hypothetical protein